MDRRGILFCGVLLALAAAGAAGVVPPAAEANGILRNGIGARAMALGGADVSWADDALGAMGANPAGLGFLSGMELGLGLTGVVARGEFTNRANADGDLSSRPGFLPDGAFALRLPGTPVTLGFAVIPESGLSADWDYVDTPGGLTGVTSYGRQEHRSEILVLRSALGAGVALLPNLSLGASIGAIYNSNQLEAPYIFQSHPVLRSFKTLLDLETEGWGWSASAGLLYRPHPTVSIGLSYTSPTTVHATGSARGTLSRQFIDIGLGARPDFRYDAEVETTFPQRVAAGLSWRFLPRWRLALQVDWIDWSDSFDRLPVKLTNGNNPDINGVLGTNSIRDTVPLGWEDRFVFRGGLEYAIAEHWLARVGYAYGQSPVPDRTLLPLTAAIMEHTVTTGVGYQRGRYRVDFAYQLDVPASESVGTSGLAAGEYSNSRTEVTIHWLALTASIRF